MKNKSALLPENIDHTLWLAYQLVLIWPISEEDAPADMLLAEPITGAEDMDAWGKPVKQSSRGKVEVQNV